MKGREEREEGYYRKDVDSLEYAKNDQNDRGTSNSERKTKLIELTFAGETQTEGYLNEVLTG